MAKFCEHDRVTSTCSLCRTESVFHQYQYKAAKRGLSFRLTFQEFRTLTSGPCWYCGDLALGIDRKDNRIGYISSPISNVVSCCSECNFAKRVMLPERFIRMAERITRYQQEKLRKQKAA